MLAGNRKHIKTKEGYEPILLTYLHLELHCVYAFAGAHSGGDETNQGSNVFLMVKLLFGISKYKIRNPNNT
jgi:hypothetical protein